MVRSTGADGLLERAGALLADNTREGFLGGRRFVFSAPSFERYVFQWFWDSCFHAIVWARIDVERACEELRGLLAVQGADGLIPHVVFWDRERVAPLSWHYLESRDRLGFLPGRAPLTTAMMQPPVIAQAVEAIADAGGESFLAEALPAIERHYRYLARERDPDRDALVSIVSQFESGLDYSPVFDTGRRGERPTAFQLAFDARLPQVAAKLAAYRPPLAFRLSSRHVEDVLVNSVYADGLAALARLAGRAGDEPLRAWAAARSGAVLGALLERCYDERRGLFLDLTGPAEERAQVKTIISLLPLLLADLPSEVAARLLEHLTDPREFWPPYPVPSVALDEPAFLRDSRIEGKRRIWRGPCSLNTNWLLALGLRRHGEGRLADELAERSRTLVEEGGFNEFYDPLDGTPVGAARFGWATLGAVI